MSWHTAFINFRFICVENSRYTSIFVLDQTPEGIVLLFDSTELGGQEDSSRVDRCSQYWMNKKGSVDPAYEVDS